MIISNATRNAAQKAAHRAATRQEAKAAYQKIYQKAYRARQKVWTPKQKARIKEIEANERDRARIAREAFLEKALEQMLAVRTQLMTHEHTMQMSHLGRAHFFFNQAMGQLYPDTDFFFMEPIPCGQFDYGHRINEEESE